MKLAKNHKKRRKRITKKLVRQNTRCVNIDLVVALFSYVIKNICFHFGYHHQFQSRVE